MANSSIFEKIVQKGQKQNAQILEDGRRKAQKYHDDEIESTQKDIEDLIKKHQGRNNDRMKTKLTEIEQKAKQSSLNKKKALIDNVFELAKDKLVNLDDSKLSSYVFKRIDVENLKGNEIIKVNKTDYDRYVKLFSTGKKKDNKVILDKLTKTELLLSNEFANICGGFIIVGEVYDINYSFESVLENIKDKHETDVANLLFGGN